MKKLTPEQKAAMQAGRRALTMAGNDFSMEILKGLHEQQRETISRARAHLQTSANAFLRAYRGSKAAGIKAKCIECCNFERAQVAACRVYGCPLYQFRPFRTKGETAQ